MAKQPPAPKTRRVPQRTCIACRQVEGKRGMIRLVRTAEGVVIDPTGKQAGRGAYLHPVRSCWESVLKGNRIDQALRTRLTPEERRRLVEFMQTLPEADPRPEEADGGQHQVDAAMADQSK